MKIQRHYFNQQKNNVLLNNFVEREDINEIVHRTIAVPEVAGHTTGAAVDVLVQDAKTKSVLDFGTKIYTFDSKDIYTFSPFICEAAKQNRLLLRKVMLDQGFAPYNGQWWHFSYGDKEWAFYYKKKFAIYNQKNQDFVLNETNSRQSSHAN